MQDLAGEGYSSAKEWSNMMDVDEDDIKRKDGANPGELSIRFLKSEYDFGILVFLNYMDLELCTADLWGEYRKLDRAMVLDGERIESGYFLCNGYYWDLTTKEHIDSLKIPVEHETGSMTDPRDGRKYQTVSFNYEGKTYEWMAEDFKYDSEGLYTWTEAMQINGKYMTDVVEDSVVDEVHQGICPDGWHISSTEEWNILVDYVGDVKNLLNENWRTSDLDAAFGKDLIGVFYNRFDFNLMPMDTVYLEVYYHSYRQDSYHIEELDEFMKEHYQWELEYAKNDEERCALAHAHKVRVLGDEEFKYFKSWKNSVIRELAPHMPGAKPLEMAHACKPKISAAEVSETLDFLVKAKLLKKDRSGNYRQTDKSISMGSVDAVPVAARDMQRQMGEFAIKSLNLPLSERDMSGITMGLTQRAYDRIRKEIADFRRRVIAIASDDDDTEQVYRMNIQLFPMSEKLNGKRVLKEKKDEK